MTVKIPTFWTPAGAVQSTTVEVGDDGSVTWRGAVIGYISRGTRTYSPPVYRGSRIVKYNKSVAEWHGSTQRGGFTIWRQNSRKAVIERMIERASRP